MATGWIQDNNKWYYLNNDGTMVTEWLKVGGQHLLLPKRATVPWLPDGIRWITAGITSIRPVN